MKDKKSNESIDSESDQSQGDSSDNRSSRWRRKAPLKKRIVVTEDLASQEAETSASCEMESPASSVAEADFSAKKQRGKPLKMYRLEERKGMDVLSNLSYRIEIDHSIKELDDIMSERKSDTHRLKSSQITILRRTIHTVKELLSLSRDLKEEKRKLKEQVKQSEMESLEQTSAGSNLNQMMTTGVYEDSTTMIPCTYAIPNIAHSPPTQYIYYPSTGSQQTTYSTVINNHYSSSQY